MVCIDWTKLVVKNKCTWIHWCLRLNKYNYVWESIKRCYIESSSFTREIFLPTAWSSACCFLNMLVFPLWLEDEGITCWPLSFESFCTCFFSCKCTAAMMAYWLCIEITVVSDLMLWAAQQVVSSQIYGSNAMRAVFSCGIPTGRHASLLNTQ